MAADDVPRKNAASRRSVTLVLTVLGPGGTPTTRHTAGGRRILVGRGADNDVVLGDGTVSARHARIDIDPDGAFVTDLGSTNGTRLDGRRVTGSTPVATGDVLELGNCRLLVETAGPGSSGAGSPGADATVAPRPGDDGTLIPARHRRTVLVAFDAEDTDVAAAIVERLQLIGHEVMAQAGRSADGWGGRLLDTVWRSDAALFVVSAASAASEKVHREVHLAGAERTPVVPVIVGDAALPPDLAYYLERREPVDLRRDVDAGLSELQRRLDDLPAKRLARPRRLVALLVVAALVLALVAFAAALVL